MVADRKGRISWYIEFGEAHRDPPRSERESGATTEEDEEEKDKNK